MDWSRAKLILIVAFSLLNLFLFTQINRTIEEKSLYVQPGKMTDQRIRQSLQQSHIKVAVSLPKATQINPLLAQVSGLSQEWIKNEQKGYHQTFFPPLLFRGEGDLQRWAKKRIPYFKDYRLHSHSDKKWVFYQTAHDTPIWDGFLIFHKNKAQEVTSVYMTHYQYKEMKRVSLLPSHQALFRLIDTDELSGFSSPVITNVTLGYRAKSNPNEPKNYYLMPYWRFTVNHDKIYDVNALNGNIET